MTLLQQVVFELTIDYLGHPYYVSGNAILHALSSELSYREQRKLRASHGVFVPGAQMGRYPEAHSQSGTRPGMGSSLPDVESYADLFLTRHAEQAWLLDSVPRDLRNVPDVRVQSGHPGIQPETIIVQPESSRRDTETRTWHIHAYLHATDDDVLPLPEALLDGLQFGAYRNHGYGTTRLADTQTVRLEALDYSRLRTTDEYLIELVTPYVLTSEHPKADKNDVPWWWRTRDDHQLRRRREKIVEQRDEIELETVDHGQVVGYAGDAPIETAKNGITRVGTHSKYGFGEFRIKPV